MYRRRFNNPQPKTMKIKYAGPCACCGEIIPAGRMATYYPPGTISSFPKGAVGHMGGLEGNSSACWAVLRDQMAKKTDEGTYPDPGELAEDRWNETHR